ncbi:WXG100 family type VII secretion target [Saccharopolyspora sp. CA-218241]|uniref:WXG100 family type VII secretion target n=1 Tax=Saccharopolyspora sp. CA-218241 TaxID=3240027 RepID=UPI003D95BEA6
MTGQQPVQTASAGMQQAAQRFDSTAGEFNRDLQNVMSTISTLRSTWTGEASVAFNRAMDDWGRAFNVIIASLNDLSTNMVGNRSSYESTEADNVGAAGSAGNTIPSLPGV